MAQPVKFAFDTPFASARGARRRRDTFDLKELEEAKRAAHDSGFAEGAAMEKAASARREAEALERIARALRDIAAARADAHAAAVRDGARLALDVARRFAGNLLAIGAAGEIETLLRQCLESLHGEARIVLRVAPEAFDVLGPRIDGLAPSIGFDGKIVLVGDASLAGTACRVEWADGGAERDDTAAWAAIDAIIDRLTPPADAGASDGTTTLPRDPEVRS
jgi:flagellar assembly protein FliH